MNTKTKKTSNACGSPQVKSHHKKTNHKFSPSNFDKLTSCTENVHLFSQVFEIDIFVSSIARVQETLTIHILRSERKF